MGYLGFDVFSACVYRKYEIIESCKAIKPFVWHRGKIEGIEKFYLWCHANNFIIGY